MARIYISVGSNIDRAYHIQSAVKELSVYFGDLTLSSVYDSEAVGFTGNAFYNMVIAADTSLDISQCVALFKKIEDKYGRVRGGERFSGRTLDLDLLTYDQVICQHPVPLPRPEILENAFVLWPLAEIAPDEYHPVAKQCYAELWQQYAKQQALRPITFSFTGS